jgi:predicted patatin/cPLA2 family phospholipase
MVLANQLASVNSATVYGMTDEFVEKLAGSRFIDQRRIRKMVDIDYLVQVTREVTSVKVADLTKENLTLEIVMTDAQNGAAHYVDLAQASSDDELNEALRATMAIPVLYPPKVRIGPREYIDGGIADPLPVMRALRKSPKIIIAISSVTKGTLALEAEGREATIIKYAPGIAASVKHLMLSRNPLADAVDSLLDLRTFWGTGWKLTRGNSGRSTNWVIRTP